MMNVGSASVKWAGRRRLVGLWVAGIALAIGVPGCITAAVTTAIIYAAGTTQYTAKVHMRVSPSEVYAAMLRILERRPDVKLESRDDVKRRLEISKGRNHAVAQVTAVPESGLTELQVTAKENETDMSHKDLAIRIVQQVCAELGMKYQVVEQK